MNTAILREYAEKYLEAQRLGELVKNLNREMGTLEGPIRDELLLAGVTAMPFEFHGGVRVNVHLAKIVSTKLADGVTKEDLCMALKRAGLGELVREDANMTTVGAWVRERLAEKALPPSIEKCLSVTEITDVRAAKTTKAESASDAASKNLKKSKAKAESKTE